MKNLYKNCIQNNIYDMEKLPEITLIMNILNI